MVVIAGISGSVIVLNQKKGSLPVMGSQMIQEASAEKGSISKTIVGTGNLEADTPVNVTVPSGVVIDQVKVESGDHVSAGDVLATVDSASVLSAMQDVQEEIENLDEEINETKDDEEAEEITASVEGRVKRIYVSEGSSIADSMLENGAVILLSIDGRMAVKLEAVSAVAEGDSVAVFLPDGSEKTGTIESVEGNTCVITFTDSGVGLGETVSVTDSEGNFLGSGEAYIHQQLAVTATGGTVDEIKVSEDESVSAGTTLLTLTETTQSARYREALAQREAYAETLQKLIELSKSGSVMALMDGTIQSVNVSDSSSGNSQSSSSSQVSSSGGSAGKVSNMAYGMSGADSSSYDVVTLADTEGRMEDSSILLETDALLTAENQDAKIQFAITGEGECTSALLVLKVPKTGESPQTEVLAADGSYTGTVTYEPGDRTFAADTVYRAQVQLTASEGWYFQADSISGIANGAVSGITVSSGNKELSFTVTYPATEKDSSGNTGGSNTDPDGGDTDNNTDGDHSSGSGGGTDAGSTGSGSSTGSSGGANADGTGGSGGDGSGGANTGGTGTGGNTGGSGTTGVGTGLSGLEQTGAGSSGTGGITSGSSGNVVSGSGSTGTGSSNTGSSSDTAQASQYSTDVAAFTMSSDDNMVLSVNVDELDINSVSNGQTAALTFDAIEDKEFEGEVTKVGSSASASGGVAKYSVNITVARDSRMKTGMNASATITVESREDIITIPVDAIQEKGNRTFVYTGKDADGSLSGETEVTTGLSDGSTVEITEGLAEGDTVYYRKVSVDNKSGSQDSSMPGDFGGMGGGMMEDRGSGSGERGGMPDFGGQGQMQSPPSMD